MIVDEIINGVLKYLNRGYHILLEADLIGLMFHTYLLNEDNDHKKIHVDTRVEQSKTDREKIDFVIGKANYTEDNRPKINPELVIEAKSIPEIGFTETQKRKRLFSIIKDIEKIRNLELTIPKIILIFDGTNYFNTKINEIISKRDNTDDGIEIIRIFKSENKWIKETY